MASSSLSVSESGDGSVVSRTIDDIVMLTRPSIVAIHGEITQTDIFGPPLVRQAVGTGFVLTRDGRVARWPASG